LIAVALATGFRTAISSSKLLNPSAVKIGRCESCCNATPIAYELSAIRTLRVLIWASSTSPRSRSAFGPGGRGLGGVGWIGSGRGRGLGSMGRGLGIGIPRV
jgi:hypothetical protein